MSFMSVVAMSMATIETLTILEMRMVHKKSKAPISRPRLKLMLSTLDVSDPFYIPDLLILSSP